MARSPSRNLADLLVTSATIPLGAFESVSIDNFSDIDLAITPEILQINVDVQAAGHAAPWLWSWKISSIPYARSTILNLAQTDVPLYKAGTYTVYNFAAHDIHAQMSQTHKLYLKWIKGPGTQNNVSWSVSTLNVQGISVTGVNNGTATEVQRLLISVPENVALPSLTAPTISYDVSFANAGAYTFEGIVSGDNPNIDSVYRGGTYTFNLDSSLTDHPFYLTTDDGSNYQSQGYVGEYTNGVTGSRNTAGTLVFTVPVDAPDTLYYQCGQHSAMRGSITVSDLAVETNETGNYVLYFQHGQAGHAIPVEIKPKPTLATGGQSCLVYDASTTSFIPQDLGIYLEKTSAFQEKLTDHTENVINSKINNNSIASISTARQDVTFITNLYQQGTLQIVTGSARWYAPFNLTITDIKPKLSTSADASVALTIRKNNVSTKTGTIPAGQTVTTISSPSFTMAEGDYITLDISSVGITDKGEDLVVMFKYIKN